MNEIQDIRLTEFNVKDINCCPGGLEIKNRDFKGNMYRTLDWRKRMIENGMTGFVSYSDDAAHGFVEYMPAEKSPFPIDAPGAAVLMCYHWSKRERDTEEDHLLQERRLIELVLEDTEDRFTGVATLGWDNLVHYPIDFLKNIGFEEIENDDYISLMWYPHTEDAEEPNLIQGNYEPKDLSEENLLSIELAHSSRCPYSIHNGARVKEIVSEIEDDRIRFESHMIDDHQQAIKFSVVPWNWEWMFVNGEELDIFNMKSDDIKDVILEKLEEL